MCSKHFLFILSFWVGLPKNRGFDFSVRSWGLTSLAWCCSAAGAGVLRAAGGDPVRHLRGRGLREHVHVEEGPSHGGEAHRRLRGARRVRGPVALGARPPTRGHRLPHPGPHPSAGCLSWQRWRLAVSPSRQHASAPARDVNATASSKKLASRHGDRATDFSGGGAIMVYEDWDRDPDREWSRECSEQRTGRSRFYLE